MAVTTTFLHLLNHFTLHDSMWEDIHIDQCFETTLSIRLDSHWNMRNLLPSNEDAPWPRLIIKIERVLQMAYDYSEMDSIIDYAESTVISKDQVTQQYSAFLNREGGLRSRLKKLPEIHETTIHDIFGNSVVILHGAEIEVEILSEDGSPAVKSLLDWRPLKYVAD